MKGLQTPCTLQGNGDVGAWYLPTQLGCTPNTGHKRSAEAGVNHMHSSQIDAIVKVLMHAVAFLHVFLLLCELLTPTRRKDFTQRPIWQSGT